MFTVYIIDDDESVRNGFMRLMRAYDLQARAYSSQHQFLEKLEADARGCVLLDINMPDAASSHLTQSMQRQGVQLPVIAVATENDDKTRLLTRQLGACFLLHKPVDDQALIDAICWVSDSSDAEMGSIGRAGFGQQNF